MNWTIRLQLVALMVATSALTSYFTTKLLWHRMASVSGMTPAQRQAMAGDGDDQSAAEGNPMSITFGAPVDKEGFASLESQVKAREGVEDAREVTTIDLKPYVNAALTDPLADAPGEKGHTLERLPMGVHAYGGVRFDVEGLVQLSGASIPIGVKLWPESVPNIVIGKSCKKIHLLHSAFNINGPNTHPTFAKLVLHYTDGTQEELELVGGTHALKCTAPAVPPNLALIQAPQTEMGWIGSDEYLDKNDPGEALHLYRTTLDNPKPGVVITSLDYVSTMGNPAPFLAGLTLE